MRLHERTIPGVPIPATLALSACGIIIASSFVVGGLLGVIQSATEESVVDGSSQCDRTDPRRQSDHGASTESFFRKIDLLHPQGTEKTDPAHASSTTTRGEGTSADTTTSSSTKRALQIRGTGDSWNPWQRGLLREWQEGQSRGLDRRCGCSQDQQSVQHSPRVEARRIRSQSFR